MDFWNKLTGGLAGATDKKIRDSQKAKTEARAKGYQEEQEHLGSLDTTDKKLKGELISQYGDYKKARDPYYAQLESDQDAARADIDGYMKDANNQYTGTTQPRLQSLMEDAQRNQAGAMTLQESMDPNNRVQQATRQRFEQQAQGEGRQGLADVGIMQAMGAQSLAGQLGGAGPMTGGQMQALMGQNMSQAGQAMANTQRRIQGLRDQGIDRGYAESDKAYGRGLQAKDRYRDSIGDVESAAGRHRNEMRGYTGDLQNLSRERFELGTGRAREDLQGESGLSGMTHQLDTGGINRRLASSQKQTAGTVEDYNSRIKGLEADKEQKWKALGGGIEMLGGLFGQGGGLGGGSKGGGGTGRGSGGHPEGTSVEEGIGYNQDNDYQDPGDMYDQGNDQYVTPEGDNSDIQPNIYSPDSAYALTDMSYNPRNPYRRRRA